jgi:hypothetical protein
MTLSPRLVGFALLIASGCAPAVVPLDKAELARLKGEQIRVVTYQPPRFLYQAPSPAFGVGAPGVFNPVTGGFIGGMAADPRGQVFAIDSPLADPAAHVRDVFLKGLAGRLEGPRLVQVEEPLPDDDAQALQKKFGAGAVLDFKTESWGLLASPLVSHPYQMIYAARARLLHLSDGRVLWQGQCRHGTNLDVFKANSTPVLKEKFAEAAEICAEELLAQFFGNASKQ